MDIFCKIIDGELPCELVYENEFVKCFMDINPNSPGHTLIVPKKHYTDILDMDNDIITEVHKTAKKIINSMMNNLPGIDGVVTTVNYGKPQIVKHYHYHLIPTYHSGKPKLEIKEACNLIKKDM